MEDLQKKTFAKTLVTNSYFTKEFKQYVKKAKLAKVEDKSDYDANITCFHSIAVRNSNVGAYPPFPFKLDRRLEVSSTD